MKKIIVVGASSGIGKAIAEAELKRGSTVLLIARREKEMKAILSSWNQGKEQKAFSLAYDVTDYRSADKMFAKAIKMLGGLDEIYYASGVMPSVDRTEYNTSKDHLMMNVNILGAMSILNLAASFFTEQKKGRIIGISSIAGERGRKGNPGYHTSKAALNTYLESLRNRLSEVGVQVTTIKPGYIKTDMVKGLSLPEKGLLKVISPELAAEKILKIVDSNQDEAFVPSIWSLVGFIIRNIPNFIFKKMSI